MQSNNASSKNQLIVSGILIALILVNIGVTLRGNSAAPAQSQNYPAPLSTPSSGTTNLTNLNLTGELDAATIVANGTPVFWATAIPTSTPQPTLACQSVNVAAGAATLVAGTYPSTPSAVTVGLGTDRTTDNGGGITYSNATGVVTLKVWQLQTAGTVTPQAATTTVPVSVCVK